MGGPGSDGGKESTRLGGGENQRGPCRGFFQELQECVRCLGAGFLRGQGFGVSDDENLAVSRGREALGFSAQASRRRQIKTLRLIVPGGSKRVCPKLLEGLSTSLFQGLSELVRSGRVFRPGKREIPVEVRVRHLPRQMAGMAFLTRASGPRGLAKEEATQPEGQVLLSDSSVSMDQEGRRERSLQRSTGQGLEKGGVATVGMKPHGIRERDLSHWRGSMAWGAPPATGALI